MKKEIQSPKSIQRQPTASQTSPNSSVACTATRRDRILSAPRVQIADSILQTIHWLRAKLRVLLSRKAHPPLPATETESATAHARRTDQMTREASFKAS